MSRGWRALATALLAVAMPAQAGPLAVSATLHTGRPGPTVDRHLFAQFAEHLGHGIYEGVWVGPTSPIPNVRGYRKDVLAALQALHVPMIRWPGGCFADEYHWREGVGPRARRPVRVNTHWGGVTETNAFGTHEFLDYAELVGAEPYIAGNVGDASPDELAQWTEYMTSPTGSTLANERRANGRDKPWRIPLVGVGNELWGCGGNMRAEYAADVYRRYQTFVKSPATQRIGKVASGPNNDDYHWTEVMMREAAPMMDALSLHYYTWAGSDWGHKIAATSASEDDWAAIMDRTLFIDELLTKHSAIMDQYDPQKRVALALDEWGTWYAPEPGSNPGFLYQQNTLRDAVVASLNLNIFARHADRLRIAAIAQMVNVLQAMILTDGPRMVLTPTYHVFMMYRPFQDATYLPLDIDSPDYAHGGKRMKAVQGAAVRGKDGRVHIALTNLDPTDPAEVRIGLDGAAPGAVTGQVLTAATTNAMNTFDRPDAVRPMPFADTAMRDGKLVVRLPAKSVVMLEL